MRRTAKKAINFIQLTAKTTIDSSGEVGGGGGNRPPKEQRIHDTAKDDGEIIAFAVCR